MADIKGKNAQNAADIANLKQDVELHAIMLKDLGVSHPFQ